MKLYYEVHGNGQPLLLIHGNGGSGADFKAQIPYFKKRYRVIAMDSRDQGRSADSPDAITYEKMTDDVAALLDYLKVGPVDVLGSGTGERVLIATGSVASSWLSPEHPPIDALIIGSLDQSSEGGETAATTTRRRKSKET